MKKIFNYVPAFAVAMMALSSCSSEEPAVGPDDPTPGDGVAYMAINITSANNNSRATTTPGYEDGAQKVDETTVNDVKFYFFDGAENNYAYMNYVVTIKNFNGEDYGTDKDNIEVFGRNMLVLQGIKDNNYPKYMVTVLNNSSFVPGETLQETQARLVNQYKTDEGFVMSTTSYLSTGTTDDTKHANHDDAVPYATKLNPDNFKLSADDAIKDANVVDVYVERLAAKFNLSIGMDAASIGKGYYALEPQTVAGLGNTDEGGTAGQAKVQLYFRLDGWALSGTAPTSYMCKDILEDKETAKDEGFHASNLNFTWNVADDFRSFWGKSVLYNKTIGANSLKYVKNTILNPTDDSHKSLKEVGGFDYAFENTNLSKNYMTTGSSGLVIPSKVTHLVVFGAIVDAAKQPIELIDAFGQHFTKDSYVKFILNRVGSTNGQIPYVRTEKDGKYVYTQLDESYFKFERPTASGTKTGQVKISVDADKFTDDKIFAKKGPNDTWVVIEKSEIPTLVANLNTAITSKEPTDGATIHSSGLTTYYIPIEHLGASVKDATNTDEGYYGVVRNHWYNVTISKIKSIGHGIWDPNKYEEPIIPDEPEDPLYYFGAKINILSWKIVNQNTEI